MRRKLIIGMGSMALVLVLVSVLVVGAGAQANSREIDAIVSTGWLEDNIEDVVVLDVRTPFEYADPVTGHIPGAINSYEGDWYINDPVPPFSCFDPELDFPCMELPPVEDIVANIEAAGITADSLVVVVSRTVTSDFGPGVYAVAGATRVAMTLIYAGVENVAILDGGWDKWVADGGETTTEPGIPASVPPYIGEVNEAMFVSKDYVENVVNLSWWWRFVKRTVIVDGRDADVYFGVTNEPWAAYPGHIPGATSLPVPWLWNIGPDYIMYKDTATLGAMAAGVAGKYLPPKETIVYCGVGGYASTDWFVLSEVLGYRNVKVYDGSYQEWSQAGNPVVLYEWE